MDCRKAMGHGVKMLGITIAQNRLECLAAAKVNGVKREEKGISKGFDGKMSCTQVEERTGKAMGRSVWERKAGLERQKRQRRSLDGFGDSKPLFQPL